MFVLNEEEEHRNKINDYDEDYQQKNYENDYYKCNNDKFKKRNKIKNIDNDYIDSNEFNHIKFLMHIRHFLFSFLLYY